MVVIKEFEQRASAELNMLKGKLDDLFNLLGEMLTGFGHDPSKIEDVGEVLGTVNSFRLEYKNIIADMKKAKEKEEREKEKAAGGAKGQLSKTKSAAPGRAGTPKDAGQQGVLDQLMSGIRKGNFKGGPGAVPKVGGGLRSSTGPRPEEGHHPIPALKKTAGVKLPGIKLPFPGKK
eukprot:TRINITY_DN4516_c0_g1_i2.p1 TRINITY_DN4516_c0_g1~~TRINITY_DN4516_c0_g1_i2.p1  ORF type:complete len:176 (-),score=55.58 TRINITY_DN4516_c0_g1_i2:51-578(-)